MPVTAFRPELDHVVPGAAWSPTAEDESYLAGAVEAAATAASAQLRASFAAVFEPLRIAERLERGRDLHLASVLRPERAAALAAVDHFTTRTPVAPLLRGRAAAGAGALARVRRFLRARVGAWLEANGAETLSWDAVLRFVPHPWLPVDRVTRAIEDTARALGYADVAITLDLQPPGGSRWVRDRTVEAWDELRRHLDAGRPRPIDLFTEAAGAGPRPPHTVVAYGYDVEPGAAFTLRVYDPGHGPEERRIRVDLAPAPLDGAPEAAAPGVAVRGFRCPVYAPARPPALGWALVLRLLGLEGLAWRIARWRAARRARRLPPAANGAGPAPAAPGPRGAPDAVQGG